MADEDGMLPWDGSWKDTPGLVSHNHPDTSYKAAELVMPSTGTLRRQVYDFIKQAGARGATDIEIQVALRMDGNTERPRRVELVNGGLVRDSGHRREIKGRQHVIWEVSGAGAP